jgi:transposase-like protein
MKNKTKKKKRYKEEKEEYTKLTEKELKRAKLQNLLWKFGLRSTCPRCSSKIWETGYPSDGVQYYNCSNEKCGWGKDERRDS